ncbi:MAG: sugar kinase, partial [Pseudomonadota bacterium]
ELATTDSATATLGVAGDTNNTAVNLSREVARHSAIEVAYITALGDERMSQRILSDMRAHGIGTDCVEVRPGLAPGLYAIETDPTGERQFSYWRDNSAARTLFVSPATVSLERLFEFDLVYLSGISLAILTPAVRVALLDTLTRFRAAGGRVAFDSNYRPRLWSGQDEARDVISSMWAAVDIALPSVDDELELFGESEAHEVVTRLHRLGVGCGALKRGHEGPIDLGRDDPHADAGSFAKADKVVDTTAAGDSFNAGWLAAYALGASARARLAAGHNLAMQVVQSRGAVVPTDPVLQNPI